MSEEEKYEILDGIWQNYCVTTTYEPGSVQKPCHGRVGPDDVVPGLFIFPLERIRIVLGVHSSYVSCQSCLKTQHLCKGVAVIHRDAAS